MKTVKTANGFKKIEDWNLDLVPVQLRTILQEHRATLIDKILGDMDTYIDYKFRTRPTHKHIQFLRLKLDDLKKSGIDIDTYRSIFDTVITNEFTSLDNKVFYAEIDSRIKSILFQPPLFPEGRQVHFIS
jgi:hypothetical protein